MTSPEQFTKVPNHVMEWLMTADMNMTQFRIVNTVIRHTYGFHRQWWYFTQSFLAEQTRCNQRQIARELKALVENGVLLQRFEKGKRELCINHRYDSLDIPSYDSLDIPAYDSSDTHIKKEFKERSKEKTYLFLSKEDHIFIEIYLNLFKKHMGKDHMRVSKKSYEYIMEQVQDWEAIEVRPEQWTEQVDFHLQTLSPTNNGSIIAFLRAAPRYFY